MLKTTFSECDDASYRQVFKALLPFEKEEKKRVCTSFGLVLFHLHDYLRFTAYFSAEAIRT